MRPGRTRWTPCPVSASWIRAAQCGLQIPNGARVCHYCGSHQDWRGYLNLSSTVLALLVALVSVLSTSIPVLFKAIQGEDSRLGFALPTMTADRILIVATNLGTRPGVIESAGMNIVVGDRLLVGEIEDFTTSMVAPGNRQIAFSLHLEPIQPNQREFYRTEGRGPANASIRIRAREFGGRERRFEIPLQGSKIQKYADALAARCAVMPPSPERGYLCEGHPRPAAAAPSLAPRAPGQEQNAP
jgi:hypothetical protein